MDPRFYKKALLFLHLLLKCGSRGAPRLQQTGGQCPSTHYICLISIDFL